MNIREIHPQDATKLTNLIQEVERSSNFMLFEPGERKITPEQQLQMIEKVEHSENSTILVAETSDGTLVGYVIVIGGHANRNKHSAYIVIGLSEKHRGQGIGANLLHNVEQWATMHGIHRIELTVVCENDAGLSLYKKMGFEVEGTKRHSLYMNGEYVDEYYMAKLV